jgi:lipid A ethanolaminephosphotransferase
MIGRMFDTWARHLSRQARKVSTWVRSRWKRPVCGAAPFALISAAAVVILNNRKLFSLVGERVDLLSISGLGCLATIFLAITGMVGLAFLILGHRFVLKPVAIATLLLSSVLSYFTGEFGVVFDTAMLQNVAEAIGDRNRREMSELLSFSLVIHVLLVGVLPAALCLIPRITYGTLRREVAARLSYAGAFALVTAVLFLMNFRSLNYLTREHHAVRLYATPTYALNSLRKVVFSSRKGGGGPFQEIGTDAVQRKSGRVRTVGVLVVGETARADHFSINGYGRNTNPRLGLRTLLNYPKTTAAGTSTAYSVPYMFSFLGKRFTTERAARQSNLLDVLVRAGVKVVWIDNNSGSKRVADRVPHVDLHNQADPSSRYYGHGGYYDEVLVEEMERQIASTEGDLLIVLHTMGSHGPAYYRRYPATFEVFKPCCKESSPQQSPQQEVVNAYDNTILYTDFVLDRLIAVLEARRADEDSFLFYVSDHGESLGEKGVYLHGLPELLAPSAQTHVPMLAWLSPRIVADHALDYSRLRQRSSAPCSHDNVGQTILGLFEVKTCLYCRDLDLCAP